MEHIVKQFICSEKKMLEISKYNQASIKQIKSDGYLIFLSYGKEKIKLISYFKNIRINKQMGDF